MSISTAATIRQTCRLCDSSRIKGALELKPTALCDAYLASPKKQERYPLALQLCEDCGFVQLSCVVDPEEIYRNYIFVTTSSSPLAQHFAGYAADVLASTGNVEPAKVVDIGSNDGTLLKEFQKKGCLVLGIEPAREIAREATSSGIQTIPEFLNEASVKEALEYLGPADLVTVNNLFANVDDLAGFVSHVRALLKKGGHLVIESSYLKDMLENMVFDFIYHEHLSYFSIEPLVKFFKKQEMTLVDVVPVPTKGGSLRYFIKNEKTSLEVAGRLQKMIENERQSELDNISTYRKFAELVSRAKSDVKEVLNSYPLGSVVGYGASATSTTLIEMFELSGDLAFLVDDFDAKQDTFSPGVHIPVKAPDKIYESGVEVVLILAWRYASQIISRHQGFKGDFIVPLPQLRITRSK